jgi:phosphohistidine phosphatase
MKTLILMRHAKSSWKDTKLDDCDRPLNKRGRKDAPLMGKILHEKELVPQAIYTSTAKRALQTAEGIVEKSHFKGEVIQMDSFYLAEPDAYIQAIQSLPDNFERVLFIGHNPGVEGLLQILSKQVASLPTAAVAHLVLPINHWSECSATTEGQLVELFVPRNLKEKSKK